MVNKKTVWSVTNIALRLLAVCLVVAALTALVYNVTKTTIEEGDRFRKETAIRNIFAACSSYEEIELTDDEGFNAVYQVFDEGENALGWCVDYTGTSDYGGDVNMMIGVGLDGKANGVQIISHSETFIDRYLDGDQSYTGIDKSYGEDLSSGATMSYNAIRDAMVAVEALQLGGVVC